jgi:hypothetical protein
VKDERCVGTLHGPLGDCLRPVTVGLFCYGYLEVDDEGTRRPLTAAPEAELRPLLFPCCELHRAALGEWAEHLWSDVADAFWVPRAGFARIKELCEMEADPLVMNPDPARALAVTVS